MKTQKTKLARQEKTALRMWTALKQQFNNTYLDLSVIDELNKRGLKVII